jgi:hypothetical protein
MMQNDISRRNPPKGLMSLEKVSKFMVLDNFGLHQVRKALSLLSSLKVQLYDTHQRLFIQYLHFGVFWTVTLEYLSQKISQMSFLDLRSNPSLNSISQREIP